MRTQILLKKPIMCFRCEHRALFLEAEARHDAYQPRPRMQCGDAKFGGNGCYMFLPVTPPTLGPDNPRDKRPRFAGAMLSARERPADKQIPMVYNAKRIGRRVVIFAVPAGKR